MRNKNFLCAVIFFELITLFYISFKTSFHASYLQPDTKFTQVSKIKEPPALPKEEIVPEAVPEIIKEIIRPIVPVRPVRLVIPTLAIDTNVQEVGVTKTGLLDVPNNFTDVGWYKDGVLPGEPGNAVIDGHLNNGSNIPGVFEHLSQLNTGDDIYVIGTHGEKIAFTVTSHEIYNRDADTKKIFTKNGPPELRIITCQGKWLSKQHTHEERLVVSAKLKNAIS